MQRGDFSQDAAEKPQGCADSAPRYNFVIAQAKVTLSGGYYVGGDNGTIRLVEGND